MSKNSTEALVLILALTALPALTASVACTTSSEQSEDLENGETAEAKSPETNQQTDSSSIVAPIPTVNPDSFPEIVAKVNAREIQKTELLTRAKVLQAQLQQTSSPTAYFYREVLNEIVGAELLYQTCRARGYLPTQDAIDGQIAQFRTRFPNPEEFQRALDTQGMTAEGLARMLSLEGGMQKLVQAEILASIKISDQEKQQFYRENTDKMKSPEQLRLSHILIKTAQSDAPATREAAKKKTEDLKARLDAGEDFATLASQNSDDPGSKENGGELPWVSRGDTVPAFEQAAFALAPGETSNIVETPFGYHIIKVSERKSSQSLPYDDVVTRIEEFLTQQAVQEQIQNRVKALRSEAEVEIFI